MIFAYFKPPVRWTLLVSRTIREIADDNCAGLAAQLAFYFLLSLFPAMLFLVALAGYLPVDGIVPLLIESVEGVAPGELVALIRSELDEVAARGHASLLTVGIVGALWSSSAAAVAIIDALNEAYDVEERRPWWKRRVVAIALTAALAVVAIVVFGLLLVGPSVAVDAAARFGLSNAVVAGWALLRWPMLLGSAVLGIDLVYHFAPNRRASWAWITPGALLSTGLWIVSSVLFKAYVTNVADYGATYGTITGVIVTMLWFYVSGFSMLVGAELNGVIEAARAPRRVPPA